MESHADAELQRVEVGALLIDVDNKTSADDSVVVEGDAAILEVAQWLGVKLSTGRVSLGFLFELAANLRRGSLDIFAVYDQIDRVEGKWFGCGTTKPPARFCRPPLMGLWHAHYFDARHIIRNLLNANTLERVMSLLKPFTGCFVGEVAGHVGYEMVIGSFQQRASGNN